MDGELMKGLRLFLAHALESDIIKCEDYAHFSETCAQSHSNFVKWLEVSHGNARKLVQNGLMPSEWFVYFLTGLPLPFYVKYQTVINVFKVEAKKSLTTPE